MFHRCSNPNLKKHYNPGKFYEKKNLPAQFLSSETNQAQHQRTCKHVAWGHDFKTIPWCYLLLDSNACKSGLSFQIYLKTLAQIPWIWWAGDAETMRFPGDQLMISLRSLVLLKENRYVSVRWEQDASNALVPVWCDEDAAEVWREMYQKSYVFNRIFNSAPSDELKPGHWVIYASIGYAVEIKAPWMM